MINGYDIAYGLVVGLSAPIWMFKTSARRKVFKAFRERMGQLDGTPPRDTTKPAVMIHAVSLGEMNATRAMVEKLRAARPGVEFIVSTTTETGFNRGRELYGSAADCRVIRYPLDFTGAITRMLDALKPSVVVLMELEVWPNFLAQCESRNIPVVLVNGRLTESSFRNYRLAGPITATMFGRLKEVCAQDAAYAERFITLGAAKERVHVTGTMKFDNAQVTDRIDGADALANSVGLKAGEELIWVCGSTGPGEERFLLEAYESLHEQFSRLRLVIVPRHPERFDEVCAEIRAYGFRCIRRSGAADAWSLGDRRIAGVPPVILGDTMGELRKFYSLADVVFVGRSIVDLGPRQHGSDMIEPAALAKPVIVGRFTGNFAEVMNAFRAADAMTEIDTPALLANEVERLLKHRDVANGMGIRAQDIVRREQGATQRHVDVILQYLDRSTA